VDPLLFQLGNCVCMFLCCVPYMLASPDRRRALSIALRTKQLYITGIGISMAGTYLIVLYAFKVIIALRVKQDNTPAPCRNSSAAKGRRTRCTRALLHETHKFTTVHTLTQHVATSCALIVHIWNNNLLD
jgi:hypothetical protein